MLKNGREVIRDLPQVSGICWSTVIIERMFDLPGFRRVINCFEGFCAEPRG
jgi:hypothetical protein